MVEDPIQDPDPILTALKRRMAAKPGAGDGGATTSPVSGPLDAPVSAPLAPPDPVGGGPSTGPVSTLPKPAVPYQPAAPVAGGPTTGPLGVAPGTPDPVKPAAAPTLPDYPGLGPTTAPLRGQSTLPDMPMTQDVMPYDGTTPIAGPAMPAPGFSAPNLGPQTNSAQLGHDGTQNGMTREQYRDALMGSGIRTIDDLKGFLAANGGQLLSDNGTIMTPYGEPIDALIGARTGSGQAGWTGIGGGGAAGAGGAGGTGGGAGGGTGSSFQDQVRQQLLDQLAKAGQPVTADDPNIKNQMIGQERIAESARRDRRSASAERAAQSGLLNGGTSSGAFDSELAAGYEDKGNQLSDVQGQIFAREIQSRTAQLTQLLNTAVQSGDAEAARAIQLQIAQMNAALQQAQLGQQQSQWNDQYGLLSARDQYQRDLDAARGRAGLPF